MQESLTDRELEILALIAEGATDKAIAKKLYLSINTVKWHNRQIYQKLIVKSRGEAVARAGELGLLVEAPEQKPLKQRVIRNNLPAQLSSFIGREKEIAQIKELLETQRLVTITGPGGVGKTRLALQVAEEFLSADMYPDGIFFIELAAITKADRVGDSIRDSLGISSQSDLEIEEQLKIILLDQPILLVLDNFEHVLGAAPLVGKLLAAAPELIILATSREALHLSGEQVCPLAPLSLPEVVPSLIVSASQGSEAIQLFLQRASEANPDQVYQEDDLGLIGEICTRVDGLPLAIELAAARLKIFSVSGLLEQLKDRFAVLDVAPRDAPERHQTLEKAIQWSYDLLDVEEQILFRRLSVFQGNRSLDAVEQVCCFDLKIDVLEGLTSLLSKNMIRQEEGIDSQPRFYLLESLHEFSRARLLDSEESDEIIQRHADFFISLVVKEKDLTLTGLDQLHWLNNLKADHENIRQVYTWSMENGHVQLALRLVSCLGIFWILKGSFDEGVQWVKECLNYVDSVPKDVQADLYRVAGTIFLLCCGEHDLSKKMYHKALTLYTQLEDVREMGWCHVCLIGPSEMFPEERDLALENFAKGIEYLSEVNDQTGIFQAWCNIGCHYSLSGDLDLAIEAFQKSLVIARELKDPLRVNGMLINLGALTHKDGDVLLARKLFKESIQIGMEAGLDQIYNADLLIDIASTEFDLDRPRRAAILLGAADNFYKLGAYRPQIQQYEYMDQIHESIRSALDRKVYDQAWQEGQAMTPKEAIALALEVVDQAD